MKSLVRTSAIDKYFVEVFLTDCSKVFTPWLPLNFLDLKDVRGIGKTRLEGLLEGRYSVLRSKGTAGSRVDKRKGESESLRLFGFQKV